MSLGGIDVPSVVASLQAHFEIIEQEIIEIDKDITQTEECRRKYGDVFTPPLSHLHNLRDAKKAMLQEILVRLNTLGRDLQNSTRLLKSLSVGIPTTAQTTQPSGRVRYTRGTR
eukprot:Sspe_Gene.89711::Locus_61404_Transcript_4_5_Confidence_0.455_Length_473::g.89711::m.89711